MRGTAAGEAGPSASRRDRRRPVLIAAIVAALVGPIVGAAGMLPAVVPVAAAATPDLTIVSAATYDVRPDRHLVHVTVALRATNRHADTVIRRYFVDHAILSLQPGTSGFAVTAVGSTVHPTVRTTSRTASQTLVSIAFGTQLGSGRTIALRLTFDLVDRGGEATRNLRVGQSLVTFPVWAFGTAATPGSTVAVTVPTGYAVEVVGGPLTGPTTDPGGLQRYASGPLAQPLTYAAYVIGTAPGAYRETPLTLTVAGAPLSVVVRAWLDDAPFGTRVATILRGGLPALGRLIGIPIPDSGATPLTVDEAVTRAAGGYAALFDPAAHRIAIAYDATPGVVLHEAVHAWFNGSLVADGWAAEGFAAYYAGLAAVPLRIAVPPMTLSKALLTARIPLNDWSLGRSQPTTDAYARAAALRLATLIATRAGPTGLTAVWRAAAAGEPADLPIHGGPNGSASGGPISPDWRGLLDLLETRTGHSYTDLWKAWVVRPDEVALLDARSTARADYAAAVAEAGAWELPVSIRQALDAWQFPLAERLIAEARAVLALRPALAAGAAAAGLVEPSSVRTAFETTPDPSQAAAIATAERTATAALAADAAARPTASDPIGWVGLLGSDPDEAMTAARSAFTAGDLMTAVERGEVARATWAGAVDAGRTRLAVLGLLLAAFGIAVLLVSRRRDRHRAATPRYGTLADDPRPGSHSGREPGDDR
ncbi:MAG: M1 aminopeptidase family protein [Candidatus Limnocylindrales bacterium]